MELLLYFMEKTTTQNYICTATEDRKTHSNMEAEDTWRSEGKLQFDWSTPTDSARSCIPLSLWWFECSLLKAATSLCWENFKFGGMIFSFLSIFFFKDSAKLLQYFLKEIPFSIKCERMRFSPSARVLLTSQTAKNETYSSFKIVTTENVSWDSIVYIGIYISVAQRFSCSDERNVS